MIAPLYSIEVYVHGWTISAPPGRQGIPVDALSQAIKLAPRDTLMDSGIVHHLRETGLHETIIAFGLPKKLEKWRAELAKTIAHLPPEERWWKGFDVGRSSAAIFAVFSQRCRMAATEFAGGATPLDASDFGRCKRLLDLFPEWRAQLDRVAEAYPETPWPRLVAIWSQLEAAEPSNLTSLIRGESLPTP